MTATIILCLAIPLALFIGYVVGADESARRRLRPLVREYRSEEDRRYAVAMRSAVRTPVGWGRES